MAVNVERIEHLPPARHADFYSSLGWALNLTRADMVELGYSPSVRLFEAAACAAPIISDRWTGLDEILAPGREVVIAENEREIEAALARPAAARAAIGRAAQKRVLAEHTATHRSAELERLLHDAQRRKSPKQRAAKTASLAPSTA